MELNDILKTGVSKLASDVHLLAGRKPMARIMGKITPLEEFPLLSAEETKNLIYSILHGDQKKKFEGEFELDFSYAIPDVARFRINVFLQKNGVEAVFHIIASKIPSPKEIGLNETILKFADLSRGLVLVTGHTGVGKSTTLACILDIINGNREDHILTIEDPIEFIFENKRCIVRQREIGQNTKNFNNALKSALRQDPDVILIGEMRDLETISAALTIAETGHLVFGTLHTTDAAQSVDRIIDVFPPYQQQQIRVQLSTSLKGVVSQTLLPRADGKGRIAAREIMVVTPAIANLIREGQTHQIYSAIETGRKFGMINLDKALLKLVEEGHVKLEDAVAKANDPNFIRSSGGGMDLGLSGKPWTMS